MRERRQRPAAEALRVLVADDEQPIRLLCRVNLEADGLAVTEAADGRQALELALAEPPDVAVLDVMMPHLDGWQVAERLRLDERTAGIPLVFLTAVSGAAARERALHANALYVAKPFNPVDLPAIVRRAAASRLP